MAIKGFLESFNPKPLYNPLYDPIRMLGARFHPEKGMPWRPKVATIGSGLGFKVEGL